MSPRTWTIAALLAGTLAASPARAHFLFARLGPPAEAGRTAEVFFSEQADAGDPKFVAKIAGTRLWMQPEPGRFRPLEVRPDADRLRAHVPASGSVAVVGECRYGVLARPDQTPFLLRYFPKALAGRPDELNRLEPRPDAPLEIAARIEGDHLELTALVDGRPRGGVKFFAVDQDLTESTFEADADGHASWTPDAPGRYSIYFRHDTKDSGEVDGTHYDEVRSFATLALDWPLARDEADPEAVALFREALASRARWDDFPGFTAQVSGDLDGHPFEGRATLRPDGGVTTSGLDAASRPWVEDQLRSLAMHRLPPDGDDEPDVRFADDDSDEPHPLGRLLLFEGGQFASSYRVKDRQITVVNRRLGGSAMTITTLENARDESGRFLPLSYAVHYWDGDTGALRRVETVRDRWARVGRFDLPAEHTVTAASDTGLSVRQLRLSDHEFGAASGASDRP